MLRALAASTLLMAAACASDETGAAPPHSGANHLAGTNWVQTEPEAAPPPTIQFEDTRAAGFAGCNRWFATVTQEGETLRFSQAGATRMACPEPQMAAEIAFLSVIENTRYGHYDRDALVLLDEAQTVTARFERAP